MFQSNFILRFVLFFILSIFVTRSLACDGYKVQVLAIGNCIDDPVFKTDTNFSTVLHKDCTITTDGCITTKGFTKAKLKYNIQKNGKDFFSGETDLCNGEGSENDFFYQHKDKLAIFGLQTDCPIGEKRQCIDNTKKLDITSFKPLLPMLEGELTSRFEITHDKGKKSCMIVKGRIYK